MNSAVELLLNTASEADIIKHLWACDADFKPPLSSRTKINNYAKKIMSKATRFEAWSNGRLVGFVAAYYNGLENHIVFITSVSVLKKWTGKAIATRLINQCIEHAKASGMRQIDLEVASDNTSAIRLYEKSGFVTDPVNAAVMTMHLYLESRDRHHDRQT